jgi:UDP-N-acetylmuramate dehydrogenase
MHKPQEYGLFPQVLTIPPALHKTGKCGTIKERIGLCAGEGISALYPIDALCEQLSDLRIRRGVPMRTLTTFRLGGPADAVLFVRAEEDVLRAVNACAELGIAHHIIGNGSNLIVRDGGIRGLVVVIGQDMADIVREGDTVTAGAGIPVTELSRRTVGMGLMGLEWACGIPGTLGGACAMNAGAYGGELSHVLKCVRVLEGGRIVELIAKPEEFGYRVSPFMAPERVVLSATLSLTQDDGGAAERQEDYMRRRQAKQPLSYPSAGSVFKRPPGHFAGALIESAGLKGARIGGAQVSELHAGFIVNLGDATADDVLRLIDHIRARVREAHGVELECEPRIWGEDE